MMTKEIIGRVNVPIGEVISKNCTFVILEKQPVGNLKRVLLGYCHDEESGKIHKKNFTTRRLFPVDDFTTQILTNYGVDVNREKKRLVDGVRMFLSI